MLFRVRRRGIGTASLVLHTGLSSYMDDMIDAGRPPAEEEYEIPSETVAKIRDAKATGARVIAVGTTVVRALESAALENEIAPGHGYVFHRAAATLSPSTRSHNSIDGPSPGDPATP